MDNIVGIDIGTNYVKAAAYDFAGRMVSFSSRKTVIHHSAYGFSEYDAGEIWESVCSCLRDVAADPACGFICSIGVSSIGESNVFIDKYGDPCHPIIAWFDQRATEQMHILENRIAKKTLYEITGQILSPKFGFCKLLWIKDHLPDAFNKAYKCLSMQDYILFKLTGEFATDYSLASRMMCFDIRKLDWSHDILRLANIPYDLMPTAHPGGTKVGVLSDATAALTNLPSGTPVFTGGHDQACAAVAANIFEKGIMLDSMDTAETTIIATDSLIPIESGYANALCIYPHFGSKLFRVITSIQACEASIEWFLSAFGAPAGGTGSEEMNIFELLLMEAERSTGKSDNLYYLPYIRGLQENPHARGSFIGIDDNCDRGSFVCAIIEGQCFELRRRIQSCVNVFGESFNSLRAVGSLSNSPRQMNLKAAITGKQIEIPGCREAACYGAALISAIGAGIFTESELPSLYANKTMYLPTMSDFPVYDKKYKTYLQIQDSLCKLYSDLKRF